MTEEEVRDLLLSDLCGRLPYGVKLHCTWHMYQEEKAAEDVGVLFSIDYSKKKVLVKRKFLRTRFPVNRDGCNLKPYLRPMSKMTTEELNECVVLSGLSELQEVDYTTDEGQKRLDHSTKVFMCDSRQMDWLNAHHFDYRGLIEKGLALEAPDGMYSNNE